MGLGAMVNGQIHIKFLCNTDSRENIVGPVGMGLERNLLSQHWKPGLQRKVLLFH